MAVEMISDAFLGLSPAESDYSNSQVVLVRAPYDGTTSYGSGARMGPASIVSASSQVEPFDVELGTTPADVGIHTLPAFFPSAAKGPEYVVEEVEALCTPIARDGKLSFLLGGEHSLTLGNARAVAKQFPDLSFLQIDAHLDLRDSYQGSGFSHACIGRRLVELGRVVPVGVRAACPEEMLIIEAEGLAPIWAHEVHELGDSEWIPRVLDQLGDTVYVSVDVDGFDPSVIPGTGTPVPGGLGWYQVLRLLRAVGNSRQVVGCDVVELSPTPADNRSAFAAALLVYKMIGYFVDDINRRTTSRNLREPPPSR